MLVVLLVVIGYAGWVVWQVLDARTDVTAGFDAVTAARDELDAADLTDERPVELLREGRDRFADAADSTGGAAMAPARLLPVVGRQLRSVNRLAASAAELTDVALDVHATAVEQLGAGDDSGPQRVALLRALAATAAEGAERLADLDLGPEEGLVGPLAEGRRDLQEVVSEAQDGLERGSSGASAAADLLDGPGRYLVVAANNAEMRAGAGMFLSVGVLQASEGSIELVDGMRSVSDVEIPAGRVSVEGGLAERWGWLNVGNDFRNLMVSPHFPDSAEAAADMWEAATGERVDGVLSFDPLVLEGILRATGPVDVNGRQIDGENIVEEMLVEQYRRFGVAAASDERRDELGDVVAAVVERFDSGQWEPEVMVRELASAARGRHLLAWSGRPESQEAFELAGVDGGLERDSMLLGVLNFGGNKLDRFLEVEADLAVEGGDDGSDAVVTVRMRNVTPEGLPPYIVGPHPMTDLAPGEYLGFLSLTMPGTSTGARFDDDRPLVAAGPDRATKVIVTEIRIPRGEELTLTARFRLAAGARSLVVEPSARRPPVSWRFGDDSWEDATAHSVVW